MSEDRKPFTVNDRRHFDPDGRPRAAEADEPEAQSPSRPGSAMPEPPSARPHAPPHAEAAPPLAASSPGLDEPDRPGFETGPGQAPVLDFAGLLVFLGAQAQLLLAGAGPGDEEGGGAPDLVGARGFITLLETLGDKTAGRRTPEEDRVLEGLLYELRLEYVARSRTRGA